MRTTVSKVYVIHLSRHSGFLIEKRLILHSLAKTVHILRNLVHCHLLNYTESDNFQWEILNCAKIMYHWSSCSHPIEFISVWFLIKFTYLQNIFKFQALLENRRYHLADFIIAERCELFNLKFARFYRRQRAPLKFSHRYRFRPSGSNFCPKPNSLKITKPP